MKKVVIILILILAVVYGALAVFSSSGDYVAEKLFYRAMKINRKIAANPDVAPPAMIASVEDSLKNILKRYPETKTAKGAHLALAEFYLKNKKYEQAHSTLNDIIRTYTEDKSILSKAHFLKGAVYEKQNLWAQALKEWTTLRDEYPATQLGLQISLYIGNYYKGKGEFARADKAYNEAVLFYEKLEGENRGRILGYAAENLLFQVYVNLRQYEQAGGIVEDIISNYPSLSAFAQQLPRIELIFVKQLKNPGKAIAVYSKIKGKTDNPKLIKFIEKKIEALQAQEE